MTEEFPKLAPTAPEDKFLRDVLEDQSKLGVLGKEIDERVLGIGAINEAFDASLVPHMEGLDRIVDTSGKSLETIDGEVRKLGSSAVGKTAEPLVERPVDLPPPSVN